MAICYQDVKMLWEARVRGVIFKDTLTIGHQSLVLYPAEIKLLRKVYYDKFPKSSVKLLENYKYRDYADSFLYDFLGVTSLGIIDYSKYEGANIIHDLNQLVPENLWERFDAVIDCGSLEHIFNFPVAIANLMKMLKVWGSIFITTPSNNLCGHGFYQFSPELMFRIFSDLNGFKLGKVVLLETVYPSIELTSNRNAYVATDPAIVRKRVGLITKKPVMMIVEAKKLFDAPLFSRSPLQSDYLSLWKQHEEQTIHTGIRNVMRIIYNNLPLVFRTRIQGYREKKRFSLSNSEFYIRL